MKLFFEQMYYCCAVALAVSLVTGCVAFPASPEQEEAPSPAVAVEVSAPVPTPEVTMPEATAEIDYSVREIVAMQSESALLRRQIEEHIRFERLFKDLVHYPSLSPEEAQRLQAELNNRISTRGQGGGNGDRIRLAYLLSLYPSKINDQRAISILDTVAKNEKALIQLRHLASVLRMQIQEKQRALQKLEALREVDRRLLEERMSTNKTSSPPRETPKRP
jgi:hypothetical protein